ncbi:hypothetical protein GCM10010420_36420 [Streptomyces glaucosporus]|uniref:Uncharacterized protein n=1 Tax=Streptomyces glaucosporus TaxID=284044 RepID=A0ABP5VK47_9ACTN
MRKIRLGMRAVNQLVVQASGDVEASTLAGNIVTHAPNRVKRVSMVLRKYFRPGRRPVKRLVHACVRKGVSGGRRTLPSRETRSCPALLIPPDSSVGVLLRDCPAPRRRGPSRSPPSGFPVCEAGGSPASEVGATDPFTVFDGLN